MAMEGIRGFIQMAAGLGELTMNKAAEGAQAVLTVTSGGIGGNVTSQVSTLADELLAAATSNRDSLLRLVRSEVDQAVNAAQELPLFEIATIQSALTKALGDLEAIRDQLRESGIGRAAVERLGVLETSLAAAKGAAERLGFIDDSVAAAKGAAERLGLFDGGHEERAPAPATTDDDPFEAPVLAAEPPTRPSRAAISASASRTVLAPAKKAAVRKGAAKKSTSEAGTAAPAATTAPARKATAKKAAAKKAPAKKAAVKRAPSASAAQAAKAAPPKSTARRPAKKAEAPAPATDS